MRSQLRLYIFLLLLFPLAALLQSSKHDEGMYPMSSLGGLNLQKAGLQIPLKELYNTEAPSLVDAIVRLGGCTGSFVSGDGLIITNHHCAFGSVAAISDTAHNYIRDGFVARTREQELPAQGLTAKIAVSYDDVSNRLLKEANVFADPELRQKMIAQKKMELLSEEKMKNPSLYCEVSEMFTGKVYVLFRYKILLDVRLVYVPQRTIGEYGGETDNWVWPRHSGDFSFVRAYAAPDGESRAFSKENIPYKPAKFLKVNPNGVKENDFVFVLGYPGRTFRHQPSQFFEYHQKYQLPYVTQTYDWQIAKMEEIGRRESNYEILYSSRIKTLANTTKNYKGKLQGFKREPLVEEKRKEEQALQNYILNDSRLKEQYGTLLADIDKIYQQRFAEAERYFWLSQLVTTPGIFNASCQANSYQKEVEVLAKMRWKDVLTLNGKDMKSKMGEAYGTYHLEFDRDFLKMMFRRGLKLKGLPIFNGVSDVSQDENPDEAMGHFVDRLLAHSSMKDQTYIYKLIDENPAKIFKLKDEMLRFSRAVYDVYLTFEQSRQRQEAQLSPMLAKLTEIKMQWMNKEFMPDANATMRFTYGNVRGYQPEDGVKLHPFTTMLGIIEKCDNTTYIMPEMYKQLYEDRDYDSYMMKELNDLPVNFLYNLDTTGGNSGSPVMNAKGEFIGVNFDRAFTATINDYAWNENYSRSVGCDVRYILWVIKKVAKADFLLKEMGV
ncbi:MAG: S46 family peptidase [Flavobacteriaceae bacterium]|nr:S46 family peptidase [Flavobacteriaceae bacterium]